MREFWSLLVSGIGYAWDYLVWHFDFILSWLIHLPLMAWEILVEWWHGRAFRYLLGGTPALLALGGFGALAIFLPPDARLAQRYNQEADRRAQKKDFSGALLCSDRVVLLRPGQPEAQFRLALNLETLGQQKRARVLMDSLASLETLGYAPAHLWQAKTLLARSPVSPPEQRVAERHLILSLRQRPNDPEANAYLGDLLFAQGRFKEAEPRLETAAKEKPERLLQLARVHAALGKTEVARYRGQDAQRFYEEQTREDPTSLRMRLSWAEATLFLEDFPAAVSILEDALAGSPEAAPLHTMLGKVYLAWTQKLERDPKSDLGQRLTLLEKSMRHDPGNMETVMALWAATRLQGEAADRARAALRAELARGMASALIHVALGMDAFDRKNEKEALIHLEQAYRLAPQMIVVANNLAWVLSHSQPPDLNRALQLINSALKEAPTNLVCRDTRGHILARLGRWRDALPDLQEALKAYPERGELHALLAEAYTHVGIPAMAAEHTRLAEQYQGKTRKESKSP